MPSLILSNGIVDAARYIARARKPFPYHPEEVYLVLKWNLGSSLQLAGGTMFFSGIIAVTVRRPPSGENGVR